MNKHNFPQCTVISNCKKISVCVFPNLVNTNTNFGVMSTVIYVKTHMM